MACIFITIDYTYFTATLIVYFNFKIVLKLEQRQRCVLPLLSNKHLTLAPHNTCTLSHHDFLINTDNIAVILVTAVRLFGCVYSADY